jgi:hypothetical protein
MKALAVIFGSVFAAFLVYIIFDYFNINHFIIGWLSCTAYFAVMLNFKRFL